MYRIILFTLIACVFALNQIEMKNNTKITYLLCDIHFQKYAYVVTNGYSVPITLKVNITCDSYQNEDTIEAAALMYYFGDISPAYGKIQDKLCRLMLYTDNEPFDSTTYVYQTIENLCDYIPILQR